MAKLNLYDRTLAKLDTILEKQVKEEPKREYLGMSIIGKECWRYLWYYYHEPIPRYISASDVRAIQDGYAQEAIMAELLRMIPGIDLRTEADDGEQIGYSFLDGKFAGHLDGVIWGIIEAPKTWHVWENKAVNQTKFNKLKKLRDEYGEKNALQEWDIVYYAQAQIYMYASGFDRHFLTVETPGGRDYISIRTELDRKYAKNLIEKAKFIIEEIDPPARLSESREFYKCRWCEYKEKCHDFE